MEILWAFFVAINLFVAIINGNKCIRALNFSIAAFIFTLEILVYLRA
jgi:hypothetical protein